MPCLGAPLPSGGRPPQRRRPRRVAREPLLELREGARESGVQGGGGGSGGGLGRAPLSQELAPLPLELFAVSNLIK